MVNQGQLPLLPTYLCLTRIKEHAEVSHCLFGVCGPLRDIRKFGVLAGRCPCVSERDLATGFNCVWLDFRKTLEWIKSVVSQVNEDSDLALTWAYRLCRGRAQQEKNGTC